LDLNKLDTKNAPVPIKGLCFDKDGTLFDFAATWEAWAAAFLMRICEGDEPRAAFVGRAIGFDLAGGKFASDSIAVAGTVDDIVAVLHPHFPEMSGMSMKAMIDQEATSAPQQPAVPLVPFLSDLRAAGLALGVATNDSEGPARAHLDSAGVTGYFDFIAGYDSGFGGKPGAGQLLAFAQSVDISPKYIAMIGDSTHDLRAGRAAGMRTVGVLTGTATVQELAPLADVIMRDIGEIPNWLNGFQ